MSTQPFLSQADTFARELASQDVDPNEVAKCFTHLRTFWRQANRDDTQAQQKAVKEWWAWLETISGSAAWTVIRSERTIGYYEHLYRAANTHLKTLEPEPLVEAFGWGVRLLRYYRTHPEARQQPTLFVFKEPVPVAPKHQITQQATVPEETALEKAAKVQPEMTPKINVELPKAAPDLSATPKVSQEPTTELLAVEETTEKAAPDLSATPKVSQEPTTPPLLAEQATEEAAPETEDIFVPGEQLICIIIEVDQTAVTLEIEGFDAHTQALALIRAEHFGTRQYYPKNKTRVEVLKMWREKSGRMIVEMKPLPRKRRKKKRRKKKR